MDAHTATHIGPRTYAKVLGALLALTVVTVAAASVNFGSPVINIVIALAIASMKGSLVALYFMHLRHDRPMSAVIFVTGLAMLAIFLMFCFLDTASREWVEPSSASPAAAQLAEKTALISSRIRRASLRGFSARVIWRPMTRKSAPWRIASAGVATRF